MNLVIVESPTKAKTIHKFLGNDYKIEASYGHLRDLPKSKIGIDVENGFKPHYIIPVKKRKIANNLKKEAEKAETILLASDPDREGEAIAWHLLQILNPEGDKIKTIKRISFHEITKQAIEEALKNPHSININLVNAQQGRRILDRLVGYNLSPFLWKKLFHRLSAGRVQSAALRLIVDREKEIENFKPEEYWSIEVILQSQKSKTEFSAFLVKENGETIPKMGIKTKEEADKILDNLEKAEYKVKNITKKEIRKNPLPPFTTSTLQQESWKQFHFPSKFTMRLAQSLYEKGLTTYHRTDSLNLSETAYKIAEIYILKNYGKNYLKLRKYKSKSKLIQEAHEAIRPTKLNQVEIKDKNELKLYELIKKRFVASQMQEAILNSTTVEISAKIANNKDLFYSLKASGQTLKFDGFLKVYPLKIEEQILPEISVGEILDLKKAESNQHFTQPPARYTEASLIKTLEKYGIGRPSTYVPIISVIQARNYVAKNENKRFYPTETGKMVCDILIKHFPRIVDIDFTAKMENELDKIAQGNEQWQKVIGDFYKPFIENLEKKYKEVKKQTIEEKTDIKCDKCGRPMVIKIGRYGKFLACSGFPECKNTKPIIEELGNCPKCHTGKIVRKRTKKGRFFYGCSNYPKCNWASWKLPDLQASEENKNPSSSQ